MNSAEVLAHFEDKGPTFLYGYVPTEWICIVFLVFFGLSTTPVVHFIEAAYFGMWWLLPTACLGGISEILGWAARFWSSRNPQNLNPYIMQITTTIIAPTPLIAANFVILGRMIEQLGPEYNRIGPHMYTIIFCSADVIALVVQAVGGASASFAAENNKDASKGGHIMLGGIVFQLASIIMYTALAAEFLIRYFNDKPLRGHRYLDREKQADIGLSLSSSSSYNGGHKRHRSMPAKMRWVFIGLGFSTTCVFIRSVYRTIELQNGWAGRIIQTQRYFNLLDGMMIVFAMICLNILHPGYLLPPRLRK
ncbi:RTA1-domain-containing protein [Sistotremastrum suecicum HHB10207 ss-3]|uniref:RTA1-domain-containing protein n=1 Tax=Sistotremastrum suecicum HHB10207 ss-3 TaxID=1314776 RepID=A0A166DS28_9AGAM|nr:RTA1-domain-containing protein [Sistotremastrum suecicum HHB10207 ss-3]